MREFAEAEIVIPSGPFQGRRFRCDRNPFARTFFDAVEAGKWRRIFATGPSQTGKTLICFVIPVMYDLFELNETAVAGAPSLDILADKWQGSLLPAIQASRYRDLLPQRGAGSRGGNVRTRIDFAHGPTLRLMSGGGDDKARSNFDARSLFVTETDGLDMSGESSREADKFSQLEARTRAFGDRAVTLAECTVSTEDGRTWSEYTKGTQSRIAIRCQKCLRYVTPEREHLIGWQSAENVMEAGANAAFACPSCGELWTEADRVAANHDQILMHRGQEIDADGHITGDEPITDTLGFRWTAVNNLMVKTSVIAMDEWRAAREPNEENAEKKMRQFVWAMPHKPDKTDVTALNAQGLMQRQGEEQRGRVPATAQHVTCGIDLGQRLCHWAAPAWKPHATGHLVEYGRQEVPCDAMGIEEALLSALRDFRDEIVKIGWPSDRGPIIPSLTLVDSGWNETAVYKFCAESEGFLPSKGRGTRQISNQQKRRSTGAKIIARGDHFEIVELPESLRPVVEFDTDYWKSWVQARLQTPLDKFGALTLYRGGDHLSIANHLTAERKIEQFIAGKGNVTVWEVVHRNNHWLDAMVMAAVAASIVGVRLFDESSITPRKPEVQNQESPVGFVNSWKGRH
jgi:hypothetical protein